MRRTRCRRCTSQQMSDEHGRRSEGTVDMWQHETLWKGCIAGGGGVDRESGVISGGECSRDDGDDDNGRGSDGNPDRTVDRGRRSIISAVEPDAHARSIVTDVEHKREKTF